MGNPAGNLPYEFSCACGERVRVDPMTKERRMACPKCRKAIDFTVSFDTTRRTLQVSRVIPAASRGAPVEEGSPSSAPPPPPAGKAVGRTVRAPIARCPCGTTFPVDETRLDDAQSCPGCRGSYRIVVKTESAGKKREVILVPQKPIVHRDEIIRTTIYRKAPVAGGAAAPESAAPKSPDRPPSPEPVASRRSRTRIVYPKTSPPAPPPAPPKPAVDIPVGAKAVPCPCGETFIVRKKDLQKGLTCGGCGLAATFEEVRDPQTLAPEIRLKSAPPRQS